MRAGGAEKVILMNRSGRLLVQRGFDDAGAVMQASTLAAGIHATGRRIGLLVGDEQMAQARNRGASREFYLGELVTPSGPVLILSVFGPDRDPGKVRAAFQDFGRQLGILAGLTEVPELTAREFEASLMSSLDRLFPRMGS